MEVPTKFVVLPYARIILRSNGVNIALLTTQVALLCAIVEAAATPNSSSMQTQGFGKSVESHYLTSANFRARYDEEMDVKASLGLEVDFASSDHLNATQHTHGARKRRRLLGNEGSINLPESRMRRTTSYPGWIYARVRKKWCKQHTNAACTLGQMTSVVDQTELSFIHGTVAQAFNVLVSAGQVWFSFIHGFVAQDEKELCSAGQVMFSFIHGIVAQALSVLVSAGQVRLSLSTAALPRLKKNSSARGKSDLDSGASVVLYWTGARNSTCITFSEIPSTIADIALAASSVPAESPALSWNFSNADLCASTCSITLCGFSVGETVINGTVHFMEVDGRPVSHLSETLYVNLPPPPPSPPPPPPIPPSPPPTAAPTFEPTSSPTKHPTTFSPTESRHMLPLHANSSPTRHPLPPPPPPPSPPPPSLSIADMVSGASVSMYWTGAANTTCISFTGLNNTIMHVAVSSTAVPKGTTALAWSFTNADMCPSTAAACNITLCGFSVGSTDVNGTVTFAGSTGIPTSHLNETFHVFHPPPSLQALPKPSSPASAASPKPTSPEPSSPSPPGQTLVTAVNTSITFPALSIASFSNATFDISFRTDFAAQVAAAANISADLVLISSILAGSVQVVSVAEFPVDVTEASHSVFSALLASSPQSVFNYTSFSGYGQEQEQGAADEGGVDGVPVTGQEQEQGAADEGVTGQEQEQGLDEGVTGQEQEQGAADEGGVDGAPVTGQEQEQGAADEGGVDVAPVTGQEQEQGAADEGGVDGAPVTGQEQKQGVADVAGCAGMPCYEGVTCADVAAPGSGYTCGACPERMLGDGVSCQENLCFEGNGGCDLRVSCRNDEDAGGVVCGACPAGLEYAENGGMDCVDVDGCAVGPALCSPGVECVDVVAPGSGFSCGDCPAGSEGDGLSCVDVDECGAASSPCDPRASCTNTEGGFDCGDCPAGFFGTGDTECRPVGTCGDGDNGGCDARATCEEGSEGPECGPCPAGYTGSGDTACMDTDGCASEPCFPGVLCIDALAPEEGSTCGSCPEGYRGNGESCEICHLSVRIASSSAVEGNVKRAYTNQVNAVNDGLDHAECVHALGTTFSWAGSRSDGEPFELTASANQADTLRLNFPKSTLSPRVAYSLLLSAQLAGNPEVASSASAVFYVEAQELVALVAGGGMETGADSLVVLDATSSYDPDAAEEDMTYMWTCSRDDAPSACRDRAGQPLPPVMTDAVLSYHLEGGSTEGAPFTYIFALQVSKSERSSTTSTTVKVASGQPPVPTIAPLTKVNPNEKLTLTATVISYAAADTLELAWEAEVADSSFELAEAAMTPLLDSTSLVVAKNTLRAGGAYLFRLRATDANGPSSASLLVEVNTAPSGGAAAAAPLEGVAMTTAFTLSALGWEDDDVPLWYQWKYQIRGAGTDNLTLTEFSSGGDDVTTMLPTAGLEQERRVVVVVVSVKDALGAMASAVTEVAVTPVEIEAGQEDAVVDAFLDEALTNLDNGNTEATLAQVDGIAQLMAPEEGAAAVYDVRRRRVLLQAAPEENSKKAAQRDSLMEMVGSASSKMAVTDDSVEWLASTAGLVVGAPSEVSEGTGEDALALFDSLVADTADPSTEASITAGSAAAVCAGLSSVSVAGAVRDALTNASELSARRLRRRRLMSDSNATQGSTTVTADALQVLGSMGSSMMGSMVEGEDPQDVASDTLTMSVRKDDATSPSSAMYAAPVGGPGGSSVSFPPSLGGAVGGGAVAISLLTSAIDPYADPGNASTLSATVTTISLGGAQGGTLSVSGLQEAINFSLPLAPADPSEEGRRGASDADDAGATPPATCVYWSEVYNENQVRLDIDLITFTEGSGEPMPAGVVLHWRSKNVTELGGDLRQAWGILDWDGVVAVAGGAGDLLRDCTETWAAYFPEWQGEDAGYRKYVGEGCRLADPGNNASCWWKWESQAFVGRGCVWARHAQCLCSHLTDFKATQDQELGSAEPPPGQALSASDMTSLSAADLAKSALLLGVLASLMGGATLLAWASNFQYRNQKRKSLRELMQHHGTGELWLKLVDGMWTWSLGAEEGKAAVVSGTDGGKAKNRGGGGGGGKPRQPKLVPGVKDAMALKPSRA
ncbi:hypothetical protein CYMTET_16864 [Cymbomonas tetramitiformis]|uniref:EGF-like domain-containing protein n=1 Tax=Cymbomonas tetramitiformis TaxID=36881 RepID=A0AAE0L7U8_9CHLO|nr:hypothetical protein CYMTET_16864 [Cymbomonas tetramitiformis]